MESKNSSPTHRKPHSESSEKRLIVKEDIIDRCRLEIDSKLKSIIRKVLIPIKKSTLNINKLGEGFQWGSDLKFHKETIIGRYVYIGRGFDSASPLIIGDLVLISTECKIIGNDHDYTKVGSPTRLEFNYKNDTTVIEADVWIGKRVTIKQGIRIGTGSVIGSESLVLKDVPPYTVMGGSPAKIIKARFNSDQIISHEAKIFP